MTPLAALTIAGCIAVSSAADRISLRDLAPAFGTMPLESGDTPVTLAPAPGVRRVFGLAELRRIAARQQIAAAPEREICFERPVAMLAPERLLAAMQRTLPDARIEILGFSRFAAPEGELEFPLTGLRQTAGGEFWNGNIRYAGRHLFAIWAKVRVRISSARVVTTADLGAGQVLSAEHTRVENGEMFPGSDAYFRSIDAVAGRVLRRSVQAGTPLRRQWLDAARDVMRGDTVRVEASNGGAHLEMQAVAEAGGSVGQSISVRNPDSKKTFRARIEGKGKVSVRL